MLKPLSLRHWMPLLLGLFAVLAVLLLTALNLPRHRQQLEDTWQSHASRLMAAMQGSLGDHLRLQRPEELESGLADLASLNGVQWAAVVDAQLQPLATTRLGLDLQAQQHLAPLIAGGRPQWLALGSQRHLALYPLKVPSGLNQQAAHALLVEWNFAALIARQMHGAWLQLGETLLLLLGLGLLLNHLHNRLITRRLLRFGQVAEAFAAGASQVRADTAGSDEISQLARRFNHMVGQLEEERGALRASEEQLRSLIEAAPVGMLVVDAGGRIDSANPAAATLFACAPQQLCGQPVDRLLLGPDAWPRLLAQPNQSLEFAARRGAGSFALEASCTPFQRGGQALQLLLLRDISDRKEAENRLHYLAHYDTLTGIANRAHLQARLELGLQCGESQALLFLDLDHFKQINDTLGHDIGDLLLCGVAERLRRLVPTGALLARLGGDEFIVLLPGALSSQADSLAAQVLEAFRAPFAVRQFELFSSPSIGIAVQQDGQGSATQLLKEADLALYQAKGRGRNRLAHFDQGLASAAEQRRQLEEDLRNALARDEFELYYQPQVDAQGRIDCCEALLRWHSPQRGLVGSAEFMPVLEETGLIIEVTRWTFRQACRQQRQWQAEGRDWGIAVNLSPLDFRQSDLAGALLAILAEEQPQPARLKLEITETTLLDADQQVLDTLHALRQAGLTLLLDDFGTGYASLTYLQFFPFDGVKIDRQFVAGLPERRDSAALVRGILVIAEQLGMQVIAEGVEQPRQAEFLLAHGCQRLQGYLFGRPQPLASLIANAAAPPPDAAPGSACVSCLPGA